MDLAINPLGPWEAMGLPPVRPGSGPTCSGLPCKLSNVLRGRFSLRSSGSNDVLSCHVLRPLYTVHQPTVSSLHSRR